MLFYIKIYWGRILLEAHIKEETEKLKESLRKSAELANNQQHCLNEADLNSNINREHVNMNMNLSVQPPLDDDTLFEPYHSTNSVSDSILQRDHNNDNESVRRFEIYQFYLY